MRIRIQQLKVMRIHADPDPDPQPCLIVLRQLLDGLAPVPGEHAANAVRNKNLFGDDIGGSGGDVGLWRTVCSATAVSVAAVSAATAGVSPFSFGPLPFIAAASAAGIPEQKIARKEGFLHTFDFSFFGETQKTD
jgi:hypothetical protein